MRLRPSRLRTPEWIVLAGSVVLLIAMLAFSWSEVPNPGGEGVITTAVDGWHALPVVRWFMLVTIVCGVGLAWAQAARRPPAIPVTLSLFSMIVGGMCAVALLIRALIDPPHGVRFGGVLGFLSACAVAWGGWRSVRQEGIAAHDAPHDVPTVDPFSPAEPSRDS